ncbi:MAG: insulinase family protein [Chlamydiota bacterium]
MPLDTVGQQYRNFKVTKVNPLEEIKSTLIEVVHQPSQAHIIKIVNDDPENVFSLTFRTYPESSDGAPHILEHTVLCGSEKFPVRDPFFAMNRRSLNTFMNAMTGMDFTCYPAASQHRKDFYNLLEVYLDAVFFPKLDMLSFHQEGHRLEYADPENPTPETLLRKGVVYNEMKGVLTSPDSRLSEVMMATMFPDSPYRYNSGGDPTVIPTLTHEGLKAFHSRYYHPSRCLFYFYGNFALEDHLDFLEEHLLGQTSYAPPLPLINPQPRFSAPKKVTSFYPATADDDIEDQSIIAMGWLTTNILDQLEVLALEVLEIVLMASDAAPLKKALLKSGLCQQAGMYFDNELSEAPLTLIAKGCRDQDGDQIEKLVFEELQKLVSQGLSQEMIQAAIHQLELSRTEIDGDSFPYGLKIFIRSMPLRLHGGNPEDGLLIHTLFDKLRSKIQEPQYFSHLITKYFLDNSHYVRVMLKPDTELERHEAQQEREELQAIAEQLSEEEQRAIYETSRRLKELQDKDETAELEVLPTISLDDISTTPRILPLEKGFSEKLQIFHHSCFTNDLVYAEVNYDLPQLSDQDLPWVRLFALLLPMVGCGSRDYLQNLEYIQKYTGGVNCGLSLNHHVNDYQSFTPILTVGGKALSRNNYHFFTLIKDMIESADFSDAGRLQELLMQHHSSLATNLNNNAMQYAVKLACSGLGASSQLSNMWYGLGYFSFIKELLPEFQANPQKVVEQFQKLQQQLLGLSNPHLAISSDEETYHNLKKESFFGLSEISTKECKPWQSSSQNFSNYSQGRVIASPVAFTAQAVNTISYDHPEAPLLSIASFILQNRTLHKRIREQGGAYGCGAAHNATAGKFYFYAYRDPQIAATSQAFIESVEDTAQGNFNNSDITSAKFEMIQALDQPIPPGNRAAVAYTWEREGKNSAIRRQFRNNLLKATKKDIQEAITNHLLPQLKEAPLVTMAGRELLEKENKIFSNPLQILAI